MSPEQLKSPAELAALAPARWPNESGAYRMARTALLEEEIELRRHLARVAQMRRTLPPGGVVPKDYRFEGPSGAVTLSQLFGDHDTLIVYAMMYGPERERPCPMCSAQLDAWDGEARHIEKRVGLAILARSPMARIAECARERGWTGLKFYSDATGDFWADYNTGRDADTPAYSVFKKDSDGTIRHFWSPEAAQETADPGQDPHDAPDMNPLWILLDTTPHGRGTDWYPKLDD